MNIKNYKIIALYLLSVCILSCSRDMSAQKVTLQGKILTFNSTDNLYQYYENSDTAQHSFNAKPWNDSGTNYRISNWFNTNDAFVGYEFVAASSKMHSRRNIVSIDLSGRITDRIYEAEKGEWASPSYPSRDDKYLIFTSERNLDPKIYPLEGLNPMVALGIIDLRQKEVIIKMDSFGRESNIKIKESPWLQEGYRFVYSKGRGMQFVMEGEEQLTDLSENEDGVYIFDVATRKSSLLIPGGFSAIASPVANSIAYQKDNCIIVRDLNNNKEKIIYKYKSNINILNKHWTPDGKFIFISYHSNSILGDLFRTSDEKLIDVTSGQEIPFKSIGWMLYGSFTWK